MSSNSTRKRRSRKSTVRPKKPYAAFELYAHPLGYWSKKINTKIIHFGRWGRVVKGKLELLPYEASWQAALAAFNARYPDAKAGRIQETVVTTTNATDGFTVADLCNRFLTAKLRKFEAKSDKITRRTFQEYKQTTDLLVKQFGTTRQVDDLRADDFERLRADLSKRFGPYRLGNEITRIKSVFKYAMDNDLIERAVRYGSEFKKPDRSELRRHKADSDKKLFTAAEIRLVLAALAGDEFTVTSKKIPKPVPFSLNADLVLRAVVLLGINAGAGNTDAANLRPKHLDLDGGWLNYPRGKTGIGRRVPLWPETVTALRAAIAVRPKPLKADDDDCVFLTPRRHGDVRTGATRLVVVGDASRTDYVSREFSSVLRKLKINGRKGLGFYSLRHTFATVGLQTKDRDCVKALMGHIEHDTLSIYDETGPSDERRLAVVQHVHDWLFGVEGGAK